MFKALGATLVRLSPTLDLTTICAPHRATSTAVFFPLIKYSEPLPLLLPLVKSTV